MSRLAVAAFVALTVLAVPPFTVASAADLAHAAAPVAPILPSAATSAKISPVRLPLPAPVFERHLGEVAHILECLDVSPTHC